jgi:hypothetical protein
VLSPAKLETDAAIAFGDRPRAAKERCRIAFPLCEGSKSFATPKSASDSDHIRIEKLMMTQDLRVGVEKSAKIVAARPRRIENHEAG